MVETQTQDLFLPHHQIWVLFSNNGSSHLGPIYLDPFFPQWGKMKKREMDPLFLLFSKQSLLFFKILYIYIYIY